MWCRDLEAHEILEERSYNVVKHNDLIQKSRYYLSAQEQKIIIYIISKVKPNDEDFNLYEFQISDFCKVCGLDYDNGANYQYIKKTLKDLRDKSIWVTLADGSEETLGWINRVRINKRSGVVLIKLDEMMKPYLVQLKKTFTVYSIYFVLAMKSKYSIRLYEILKSYQNLGQYEVEIEQLKMLLNAEAYDDFKDFRVKVLGIAMREINDYSDILASYELEKKGRKFHKIKFLIKPKYKEKFDESIRTWKNINKVLDKR